MNAAGSNSEADASSPQMHRTPMTHDEAREVAGRLTKADVEALKTLPMPGWKADRVFMGRGVNVSYSSTWRKSTKHRRTLEGLEARGVVERTVSRGETLWRLTRPAGHALVRILQENRDGE